MRCVYIQSNSNDRTTDRVIDWINYCSFNKVPVVRFNDKTIIDSVCINLSPHVGLKMSINNHDFLQSDSYWYRRGSFDIENFLQSNNESKNSYIKHKHLISLLDFLRGKFSDNNINSYSDNFIEKLLVLRECQRLNITIPDTLITNKLSDVHDFIKKHNTIITKSTIAPFGDFCISHFKYKFSAPTIKLTKTDLLDKPSNFIPSLFQEYVDKKIEIRSFYLKGQFYSMAIFSQQNPNTKIDCRNDEYGNKNRLVPYKLPAFLEKKLSLLYEKIGLNSGSADLIVTPNNQYVFLEVNPIGQFGWLSSNCNYHLEKIIAKELIAYEK